MEKNRRYIIWPGHQQCSLHLQLGYRLVAYTWNSISGIAAHSLNDTVDAIEVQIRIEEFR